ncbi:hypothetical protein Lal_00021721 [Lupinus albus]|uniref:Uncharacterized protein n=1 Tax=Lupinus albus TaxID=3870 RepID=A0A6A5LU89_LUPAL|nr:hypothetical protein Lalb_Chr25g0278741 [Lupinus albus]KAF1865721.1 hypothetical protein Lal_00021721 [Lupinus albus]
MEGLIPYVIHAIKKQKPEIIMDQNLSPHNSDTSNRSYHLLLTSDSFNGNSQVSTSPSMVNVATTTNIIPNK